MAVPPDQSFFFWGGCWHIYLSSFPYVALFFRYILICFESFPDFHLGLWRDLLGCARWIQMERCSALSCDLRPCDSWFRDTLCHSELRKYVSHLQDFKRNKVCKNFEWKTPRQLALCQAGETFEVKTTFHHCHTQIFDICRLPWCHQARARNQSRSVPSESSRRFFGQQDFHAVNW